MPSSKRSNRTALRKSVNITGDGKGGDRNEREKIDLVEGDEGVDSEDEDQVTETGEAQSEPGKKPVFHHEIYDRLVKLMSKQGAYTHEPPEFSSSSKDVTSFHPDQRDWGSSRAHRAPILTLWSESPGSAPTYPIGYLLFNGRLILDYTETPIRAFRHLPLTISSAVKGFRVETWIRQDMHRIKFKDILARLRTRSTPNGREPLQKKGYLTDRANAFRLKSGLVSFRSYNEPSRIAARAYIDSLRTTTQRESNQAIDRDLTADEFATLKELSKRRTVNADARSSPNANVSTPTTGSVPTVTATVTATVTTTSSSQPNRRHRPSSPSPQPAALSSTLAPAQNLPDSRDEVPKLCRESYSLWDALDETKKHFFKLTGKVPKQTDTAKSYTSQWNTLQAQFVPIWKSQNPTEEVPQLFKLGKWTGGIDRWDDDWRTKVGGEERDREGEGFGAYMDASQEGTAYLGRGGTWRSARDTWCNSHRVTTEDPKEGFDDSSDDASEENPEEGSGEEPEDAQ